MQQGFFSGLDGYGFFCPCYSCVKQFPGEQQVVCAFRQDDHDFIEFRALAFVDCHGEDRFGIAEVSRQYAPQFTIAVCEPGTQVSVCIGPQDAHVPIEEV